MLFRSEPQTLFPHTRAHGSFRGPGPSCLRPEQKFTRVYLDTTFIYTEFSDNANYLEFPERLQVARQYLARYGAEQNRLIRMRGETTPTPPHRTAKRQADPELNWTSFPFRLRHAREVPVRSSVHTRVAPDCTAARNSRTLFGLFLVRRRHSTK